MGRYKNNPDYNAVVLSRRLMESLVYDYRNPGACEAVPSTGKMQITKLAKKHGVSVLKVRKLLITAGELKNEQSRRIWKLHAEGKSIDEIMNETGYSLASINSYLPYSKVIYNMEEVSPNAIRMKRHRAKVIAEQSEVSLHPSQNHESVPRWERTNIIRAVPRGKLILSQQIIEILEAIHGPFVFKGSSYDNISGWPLPPNHIVLKRCGYVENGSEQRLLEEGFELEQTGEKFKVKDYEKQLVSVSEMLQFRHFITTCPITAKAMQ